METQTASVKKIAMNYGLLLALFSIVFSVVLYVTDNHLDRPWWGSLISFLIMLWAIVYGLKAFKKDNGGFLSISEALKTGLAISLIAGIVGAIFQYLFVTIIEPEFSAQLLEITRENMLETNPEMTQEQMDMAMGMSEKFMQPWIMAAMAIIVTLFFGFLTALIAGLIMKQNRPENY